MSVDGLSRRRRRNQDESRERDPDLASAWRIIRLAHDGTTEPVSLDQIIRRERGKGKMRLFLFCWRQAGFFSLLIHTLMKLLTIHTQTTPRRPAARMLACHIMEQLVPKFSHARKICRLSSWCWWALYFPVRPPHCFFL